VKSSGKHQNKFTRRRRKKKNSTSKEVSDGHPPEVNGSGGDMRVEVLDEAVELLGKGGGADGLACRGEPKGKRRVGRVFAEVGPHSLLEELHVGEELKGKREV
jgi:hypothetical protein